MTVQVRRDDWETDKQFDAIQQIAFAIEEIEKRTESGVYTPVATNVANLDASTVYLCQFLRVGNVVVVSGQVDVNPTMMAITTQIDLSLPIPSNLAANSDLSGCCIIPTTATEGGGVRADTVNNRAILQWLPDNIANTTMYFIFAYRILS